MQGMNADGVPSFCWGRCSRDAQMNATANGLEDQSIP